MTTYPLVVSAALDETKSKFRLAEQVARELPAGLDGGTVAAGLQTMKDEVDAAGGETRSVGTWSEYRLTALWVADNGGFEPTTFQWKPGLSFTAHNVARMKGQAFKHFLLKPETRIRPDTSARLHDARVEQARIEERMAHEARESEVIAKFVATDERDAVRKAVEVTQREERVKAEKVLKEERAKAEKERIAAVDAAHRAAVIQRQQERQAREQQDRADQKARALRAEANRKAAEIQREARQKVIAADVWNRRLNGALNTLREIVSAVAVGEFALSNEQRSVLSLLVSDLVGSEPLVGVKFDEKAFWASID